ncbi:hypothetical protein GE09DRAFT_1243416 [Coniochaeta sp. 2T2.1]|nr:hypothetical protein GE09DRAFT_1243416 [Coniochaeta sp. 2T2.1]
MRPTSYPLILASLLLNQVGGQDAQCVSLADGCSSGGVYEAAVRGAVAKFADSYLYGGQATDPVVFASALQGTTSAQIAYSCRDGSVPPVLDGRSIRTMLDKVARCPNLCGSVAISTSGQCGLGVLVAEGAGNASCWSLAVNVNPRGQLPDERPTVLGWNYLDCWADQSGQSVGQALANGPLTAPDMTLEKCLSVAAGHKYAGVQRGNQCFWGNDMSPLLTPATGQCNMACQGQPVDACGDEGRIGIYQDTNYQPSLAVVNPGVAGFSFRGCYVDSDSRIIQGQVYRDAQMTVAKCMQRAGTSRFAGVENGNECFYGSSLSAMQPNTGCSTACGGNSSEVCGGGWRLAVYENQQGRPPVVNPGIDSFENRGCFVDGETPETRVLPNVTEVQDMTVAKCLDHGRAASARYAAVQYGTECFYGDKMRNAIPGSGCDTPCGGDAGEACGGGWRLQVYEDADWVDPQVTLDMIRVGFGEVADLLAEFEQALDDWILGLSELPPLRAGDDVEVQVIPLLVARRLCMGITRPKMQYLLREPDVGRAASANLATTVGRELAGRVTLEIRKSISLTAGGVGVELIEPLPVVEGTWSYTFDWLKNWMHRTSMDRCQAEWLRKSPLVEAISIDKQGTNGDWMPSDRPQPPGAASDPNKAEMTGTGRRTFSNSSTSRTYSNSSIIRPHSNISVSLDGADAHRAPATQRLVMQQDSPAHLRWITSKHMQTRDAASGYWDIRDHVYDDRSATPPFLSGTTATVFVIDTAFAHYPVSPRVFVSFSRPVRRADDMSDRSFPGRSLKV